MFIHGFDAPDGTSGHDVACYWMAGNRCEVEAGGVKWRAPNIADKFREWGWTGELSLWGYYVCDHHYLDLRHDLHHYGSHSEENMNSAEDAHDTVFCQSGSGNDPTPRFMKGHTRDTGFLHLGWHLAWAIKDVYDRSGGKCVHLVAHSTGGLIARSALVFSNKPNYPEFCVASVVTLGTPHMGSLAGTACAASTLQSCDDLVPGSPFLILMTLDPHPNSPLRYTHWTLVGGKSDEVISEQSATTGVQADQIVIYEQGDHSQMRYSYTDGYMSSTNGGPGGSATFRNIEGGTGEYSTTMPPSPGRLADMTLAYRTWGCYGINDPSLTQKPWPTLGIGGWMHGQPYTNTGDCEFHMERLPGATRLVMEYEGFTTAPRQLYLGGGLAPFIACEPKRNDTIHAACVYKFAGDHMRFDVDNWGDVLDPFKVRALWFVENDCGIGYDAGDAHNEYLVRVHDEQWCEGSFPHLSRDTKDFYDIVLRAGETLSVTLEPQSEPMELCFVRPTGTNEACATVHPGGGNLWRTLAGDHWRISVRLISGGGSDYAFHVDVIPANQAPVMRDLTCSPTDVHPGQPVTCRFHATDDSSGVQYHIEWGDGQTQRVPQFEFTPPGQERSAIHAYDAQGTFTVRVHAMDNALQGRTSGESTAQIRVTPTPPPPPPPPPPNAAPQLVFLACTTPLEVGELGNCQMRANDDSSGVAYTIDWGDGTSTRNPTSGYASPGTTRTSHASWGQPGSYTVRVFATDNAESPRSSATWERTVVVQQTPPPPTPPQAVTDVSAEGRNGRIVLSWSAPPSSAPITEYRVYRDGDLLATTGPTPGYTDATTLDSRTYLYRVYAVSSVGMGPPGNSVEMRTQNDCGSDRDAGDQRATGLALTRGFVCSASFHGPPDKDWFTAGFSNGETANIQVGPWIDKPHYDGQVTVCVYDASGNLADPCKTSAGPAQAVTFALPLQGQANRQPGTWAVEVSWWYGFMSYDIVAFAT